MKKKAIEVFGWYGVLAILSAFALLNFGIFAPNNIFYQLLNASGALGILIDALSQKNYQPAVLNIIWFIIAIIAIVTSLLK